MSDNQHAPLWYPPSFPVEGRLPTTELQVRRNQWVQSQGERDYHQALMNAAGRRVATPCCKHLHITLCFDGTGNNLNNDLYEATPPHPTNIARMFRASIGDGHAGGTVHRGQTNSLVDSMAPGYREFYKYYMPGVGTPFPEIGDLDYSTLGQAFGKRGEDRINWALLMLVDALRRALDLPKLDNAALERAVAAMGTFPGLGWGTGHANRSREMHRQLALFYKHLRIALNQPSAAWPKLLGLKLYVYGFSRGATAARAFVSWLNKLMVHEGGTSALPLLDLRLPVSVEYLGLLDTVASVGLADVVPGTQGHMGWADGTQALPDSGLVKRCLHLVAAHEQRLSLPLESIRRASGEYPANSAEVIYPGVHSDVGGGYAPGVQGKGYSSDPRTGDSLLLSQIALNDLYADALVHGAPLKVPKQHLPPQGNQLWRAMGADLELSFTASPTVVDRFNAWLKVTLEQPELARSPNEEGIAHYEPIMGGLSLESVARHQMSWLTAWRIDRYALESMNNALFFSFATDTHSDELVYKSAEAERNEKQAHVRIKRLESTAGWRYGMMPKPVVAPGVPDFDPEIDRTQLREAAKEFREEYQGPGFLSNAVVIALRSHIIAGVIALGYAADAMAERDRMKAAGEALVRRLFPLAIYKPGDALVTVDRQVDESRNATEPEGLLRALFDDQVHDSRAWFLYAMGREYGGHYLSERMVFFGDSDRRELALYRRETNGTLAHVAGAKSAVSEAEVPRRRPMSEEQMAKAMKAIDAIWEEYQARLTEFDHGKV